MVYGVQAFFDQKNNVIIIPSAICEIGYGVDIDYPEKLDCPYTDKDLGAAMRRAFQSAIEHPMIRKADAVKNVFTKVSGAKSWRKFAQERHSISAEFDDEMGYAFYYLRRNPNCSYEGRLEWDHLTIKLLPDATDEEIGKAILKVFSDGIAFVGD